MINLEFFLNLDKKFDLLSNSMMPITIKADCHSLATEDNTVVLAKQSNAIASNARDIA